MTHGDKTKAKTVKGSKASAQQKASTQGAEVRKAGSEKIDGKGAGKSASQGKAGKGSEVEAGGKKPLAPKAGAEKGSRAGIKEPSEKSRGRAAAPAVIGEGPFITNPAIADSFSRAVKKYPNAFRKLTD